MCCVRIASCVRKSLCSHTYFIFGLGPSTYHPSLTVSNQRTGLTMKTLIFSLLEDYLFDPSLIDLILWFPHLELFDFATAAVAVLTWSWVSERLWRTARSFLVVKLSPMLGRYAFLLRYVR